MSEKTVAKRAEVSPQLPLSLAVVTLVVMVAFQTLQLVRERQILSDTLEGQTVAHNEATKVRGQLEAIASGAAQLAAGGNQNAASIVVALNDAGVTINVGNIRTQ